MVLSVSQLERLDSFEDRLLEMRVQITGEERMTDTSGYIYSASRRSLHTCRQDTMDEL